MKDEERLQDHRAKDVRANDEDVQRTNDESAKYARLENATDVHVTEEDVPRALARWVRRKFARVLAEPGDAPTRAAAIEAVVTNAVAVGLARNISAHGIGVAVGRALRGLHDGVEDGPELISAASEALARELDNHESETGEGIAGATEAASDDHREAAEIVHSGAAEGMRGTGRIRGDQPGAK